jgi:hypothetical protein
VQGRAGLGIRKVVVKQLWPLRAATSAIVNGTH